MPNRKHDNVTQLNQGVNYMDQGQQPVAPVQQPVAEQPVAPVQPAAPVAPAQQPIVNTEALKAQAGNLANNAKNGVNAFVEKAKTDKGVMIGAIVGVVLVVLLVVMVGSKLLNPSYNVVNKYMSGMKKQNAEKISKLYHEDIIEASYDGEIDDLIDELEEEFEEMEDEDTKITGYKIRECKKYSEDELEDLADYMEDYMDIDAKDVKAARKYFVRVNYDVDGEKDLSYQSVVVIKIGNKWSLYY
jgi:hypothetical protein